MHGHAGRFVDRQQLVVLVQHGELACRYGGGTLGLGHAHRRQPHLVAQRQPGIGGGAATVDAHLARADDPIDMGLGHALELAQQEVVQPLARAAFVDRDPAHGGGRGGPGPTPYNALDHVRAVSA
jgi:hypothetical protein